MRRSPTPSDRTNVVGTTLTLWPAARAASAMRNASVHVSTITRPGASVARYSANRAVATRFSLTIVPSPERMHTWDSLPPKSIATCSMAGLLALRLERVSLVRDDLRHLVAIEASHFIQSVTLSSNRARQGDSFGAIEMASAFWS